MRSYKMSEDITGNVSPEMTESFAEPAAVQEQAPVNFLDTVGEEFRAHPSLQDFKDVDGLAKSYVNAQQLIGSSVRIPGQDASEEALSDFYGKLSEVQGVVKLPTEGNQAEIDAFYNKLGRPEQASDYQLEGLETAAGAEIAGQFQELAHKLGLNQQQAAALVDYEMSLMPNPEQQQEQAQEVYESSVSTLEKVWGEDFDNRLEGANAVWDQFEGQHPEAMAELRQVAGNNPALAVMMSELAKSYNETGALVGEHKISFGVSPQEAQNKISEKRGDRGFMEAYNDGRHPGHANAVEDLARLYKLAAAKN